MYKYQFLFLYSSISYTKNLNRLNQLSKDNIIYLDLDRCHQKTKSNKPRPKSQTV